MLTVSCPHCGKSFSAEERSFRYVIRCSACGKTVPIAPRTPVPSGKPQSTGPRITYVPYQQSQPTARRPLSTATRYLVIIAAGVALLLIYYARHRSPDTGGAPRETSHERAGQPAPATNPAEAMMADLIQRDAGREADPDLAKDYQEINERHFGGKLPSIPVLWEPGLEQIGPLIAPGFTQEGLWGQHGKTALILLNPALRANAAKARAALCHEMVHEYLFTTGESPTKHGPAFQNELQRLLSEGAFQGISASEEEKASLRSWLETQVKRLDTEKRALDEDGVNLRREGGELDQRVRDLNARIASAQNQGSSAPSQDEIRSMEASRDLFSRSATDFNVRVAQYNADVQQFNAEVNRYNLMMSYPDGLDEESAIAVKPAAGQLPSPP